MASTSAAVIEAIASKEGVQAESLTPPLFEVIDGDALDALYRGRNSSTVPTVRFTYTNYCIEVNGPDRIEVEEMETAESTS